MVNGPAQSDAQIAREIVEAIRHDQPDICDRLAVQVRDGHVILSGEVEWQHQRARAEGTARLTRGVTSVDNRLVAIPAVPAVEIKKWIEAVFAGNAEQDARRIDVRLDGGNVILTGRVHSAAESADAQEAAHSAPGVTQVQNEITVGTE